MTPCLLEWKDPLIVKPCCIPIYINNTSPDSFVQYYIKNYEKKFHNHFSRILWWSASVLVSTEDRYCLGLKATIITKITNKHWIACNVPNFLRELRELEFFLNEFCRIYRICRTLKICLQKMCIRTCYLLCNRPACYHSNTNTHVRDKVFKLSLIHASVINQIR